MSLRTLHALNAKLDATLHEFQKLDLGYTYDEMYGASPCSPSSDGKKVQYPSLYVSRTKQDVMDLPETGKAVVEYVLTGRNMSKRDGKTSYGMDLQIKSFDPQAAKKADAKKKADGEAVEMGAKCSVLSAQSHEFARTAVGGVYPAKISGSMTREPKGVEWKRIGSKFKKTHPVDRSVNAKTLRYNRSLRTLEAKLDGVLQEFARGDQVAKLQRRLLRALPAGHRRMDKMESSITKRGPLAKKAYTDQGIQVIRDGMAKSIKGIRAIRFAPKFAGRQFSTHSLTVSQSHSLHTFSDRTRNGDGQFVGNVTGGADPVTMRQAYGQKPQRSLLAPGAGAAALAGAGLLGTQAGRGMTIKSAKGAARMVRSSVAGLDRKIKGKTGERWPVMGSKAKPKMREGLGEVILRSTKGKTGARMPRFGD